MCVNTHLLILNISTHMWLYTHVCQYTLAHFEWGSLTCSEWAHMYCHMCISIHTCVSIHTRSLWMRKLGETRDLCVSTHLLILNINTHVYCHMCVLMFIHFGYTHVTIHVCSFWTSIHTCDNTHMCVASQSDVCVLMFCVSSICIYWCVYCQSDVCVDVLCIIYLYVLSIVYSSICIQITSPHITPKSMNTRHSDDTHMNWCVIQIDSLICDMAHSWAIHP